MPFLAQPLIAERDLRVRTHNGALSQLHHLATASDTGSPLLLIYWALKLHVLSTPLGFVLRNYPAHRNMTLRLLEPLGELEEEPGLGDSTLSAWPNHQDEGPTGLDIAFENVSVRVGGHRVLRDVTGMIEASHARATTET